MSVEEQLSSEENNSVNICVNQTTTKRKFPLNEVQWFADNHSTVMLDVTTDSEAALYRFNRLVQDLLRGTMKRNTFRPWEIELLLDIDSCELNGTNRRETLRRYQRAVKRQMEDGESVPMLLSEYLENRRSKKKPDSSNGNGRH